MADSNIINNSSKAYGYNYASLGDIARAGHTIPKMRIKPTDNGEFVEYLDDKGDWQIGAKVVVPDMKGSNDAQAYGAALTYARRYTALLALQLVCDDDTKVETADAETRQYNEQRKANRLSFDDIREHLKTLTTSAAVNEYANEVSKAYPNPTDKQRYAIQTMFAERREDIINSARAKQ